MSKKRSDPVSKDRSQHSVDHKKFDEVPDEKVRILQDNLVFVNGLPSEASSKETLLSPEYFLRYGTVTKLILNPPQPNRKGVSYQAYVTYSSHLDAALAIIALDGYKLSDRPLKVSFGTTKYCSHYLRGNDCPNPDCFYLHKIDKSREVSSGDTRTIFKQQNAKALTYLLDSLSDVATRVINSTIQEEDEGFPSITQTLDYLVEDQQITSIQLRQAFNKARSASQPAPEFPTLQTRVQSLADPHESEKQQQKLVKSSSHSTMCTPSKEQVVLVVGSRRKQQPREGKENVNKQNVVGGRQLSMEETIEKRIIKQIWKKNNTESKSRFVKGVTTSREECSRLRGIVQKFLIATN